eukprot:CAMPEP_0113943116 /NCGR_PEP_ID=MMETSP1339-20121228/19189_1 /TAXON_ID=94617 /ORGANISM="Fibrocapsa japonica" /LENGTH=152 /DNA_ID=CAMNT_0000947891 /DNA_START=34 /DNA_END=488 /DNA_ORIENTATION=- /assembly_acc=CAM_ASM_000762
MFLTISTEVDGTTSWDTAEMNWHDPAKMIDKINTMKSAFVSSSWHDYNRFSLAFSTLGNEGPMAGFCRLVCFHKASPGKTPGQSSSWPVQGPSMGEHLWIYDDYANENFTACAHWHKLYDGFGTTVFGDVWYTWLQNYLLVYISMDERHGLV